MKRINGEIIEASGRNEDLGGEAKFVQSLRCIGAPGLKHRDLSAQNNGTPPDSLLR